MKRCPNCGNSIADSSKFCSKCGMKYVLKPLNTNVDNSSSVGDKKGYVEGTKVDIPVGEYVKYPSEYKEMPKDTTDGKSKKKIAIGCAIVFVFLALIGHFVNDNSTHDVTVKPAVEKQSEIECPSFFDVVDTSIYEKNIDGYKKMKKDLEVHYNDVLEGIEKKYLKEVDCKERKEIGMQYVKCNGYLFRNEGQVLEKYCLSITTDFETKKVCKDNFKNLVKFSFNRHKTFKETFLEDMRYCIDEL